MEHNETNGMSLEAILLRQQEAVARLLDRNKANAAKIALNSMLISALIGLLSDEQRLKFDLLLDKIRESLTENNLSENDLKEIMALADFSRALVQVDPE